MSDHIDSLANNLALLSRVRTIGLNKHDVWSIQITNILNQFVFGEKSVVAVAFISDSGRLIARNTFSPDGMFINDFDWINLFSIAKSLRFAKFHLRKYGNMSAATDRKFKILVLKKNAHNEDVSLGKLYLFVNLQSLAESTARDVHSSFMPNINLPSSPLKKRQCFAGVSYFDLSICFPITPSDVGRGLAISIFSLIIGIIVLIWLLLWVTTNVLIKPLTTLFKALENTAQGNFERIEPSQFYGPLRLLANLFNEFVLVSHANLKLRNEADQANIQKRIASQVAHDIRSPLSALDMVLSRSLDMPDDMRLLVRRAIARIKDIANNILSDNLHSSKDARDGTTIEKLQPELISSTLESIISEKRVQFSNCADVAIEIRISSQAAVTFCEVNANDFKRVISNLINNSYEAILRDGVISVTMQFDSRRNLLIIKVADNGKGIAPENIPQIFKDGFSFGKQALTGAGSGLGLSHAKKCVEDWRGTIRVDTAVGVGTTFTLELPVCRLPGWVVTKIVIPRGINVFVVDDDRSIREAWMQRFQMHLEDKEVASIIAFDRPQQLVDHLERTGRRSGRLFLIDLEFRGEQIDGLQLIETCSISDQSILVTGRHDEELVRQRAAASDVKILPKIILNDVEIEFFSLN